MGQLDMNSDIKLKSVEQLKIEKAIPKTPKDEKLIKLGDKNIKVKFRFGQIISIND